MIENIRATESLQVIVLVCVPLLFLLIAAILFLRRSRRKDAVFPDFSVTISRVGHEEAYVLYRCNGKQLDFPAKIGKGRRFFSPMISVRIPEEMVDVTVHKIVPNLALALTKLHYEYLVFRRGELQDIPVEERDAAIAELRQLGCEIKEGSNPDQVQRAVLSNWHRSSGEEATAMITRVRALMSKARGVRENFEVLARSDVAR